MSSTSRFSLAGKTVAITGGGRGLGITLALAVVEAGGHVACLDILPEPAAAEWEALQKTAASAPGGPLACSYHQCDVTSEAEMEKAIDGIAEEAAGRGAELAGCVACAGIQQKTPALDYPAADFERILRVNVTGVFITAKYAARVMVRRGIRGSIVLIGSMSGEIANRGLTCTAYNSSKAAVQQMCRSLAQEWGKHGIRVNSLSPGYIRTAMTDELLAAEPSLEKTWMAGALLGRLGTPEDFMSPAVFLLADGSSFMTGSDLRVDGGHCDENKPSCSRCSRVNEECKWGVRVGFRPVNPLTWVGPSSSEQSLQSPSPLLPPSCSGQFEIVDLTKAIVYEYAGPEEKPARSGHLRNTSGNPNSSSAKRHSPSLPVEGRVDATREPPPASLGDLVEKSPLESPIGAAQNRRGSKETSLSSEAPTHTPSAADSLELASSYHSPHSPPLAAEHAFAAANLLSLRDQAPAPALLPHEARPSLHVSPVSVPPAKPVDTVSVVTTEASPAPVGEFLSDYGYILNSDGSLLPGPTYFGLHTTLRDHLIQESLSRPSTPSPNCEDNVGIQPSMQADALDQGDGSTLILKPDEEYLLWKNWIDEVCPWLDKFDCQEHFRLSLSKMASSHLHLKYSIMAVSARQMERQRGPQGLAIPSSLALYQQAIHHLLPQLATRSTAVIASCVLLCVLEMLSSSPKAWQRHLDGCATLLQAVPIHGFSGGVDQALFWCFARMDLAGGLISSTKTLIPARVWTSESSLPAALSMFQAHTSCDVYANQIVFLAAHVVELLHGSAPPAESTGPRGRPGTGCHLPVDSGSPSVAERWEELARAVENWYERRPKEMEPVFSVGRGDTTFPTLLFSNPAAISGNQVYHTAALLLLQYRPPRARLPPNSRSLLWHARRIIGISLSNTHHGCWTNSLQPIWIAGRCLSSPEEHRVILDLLARIETESGWATRWRADDLREWWGGPE
ncbi:hypothetical protein PpBr36_07270 [Pyricularia pennisetigena]|uniref:hypothetical protein n=1 Tax=Pyricularia pennisetigena TaxID=1578925 RepID=UPI0011508CBD|nr:hypothetical protein PpBr36_07270 [Pyricularia pennisetigena]TLS25671.1 hypothetical protein PpBr36_07270 [Pyricularia pennisetigena]